MSDKKVCEVCGREVADVDGAEGPLACFVGSPWAPTIAQEALHWQLGYERLAAILTPEVLRLREAGRKVNPARQEWIDYGRAGAWWDAKDDLIAAALALPFEKPAESNHTEKQQLTKKG